MQKPTLWSGLFPLPFYGFPMMLRFIFAPTIVKGHGPKRDVFLWWVMWQFGVAPQYAPATQRFQPTLSVQLNCINQFRLISYLSCSPSNQINFWIFPSTSARCCQRLVHGKGPQAGPVSLCIGDLEASAQRLKYHLHANRSICLVWCVLRRMLP